MSETKKFSMPKIGVPEGYQTLTIVHLIVLGLGSIFILINTFQNNVERMQFDLAKLTDETSKDYFSVALTSITPTQKSLVKSYVEDVCNPLIAVTDVKKQFYEILAGFNIGVFGLAFFAALFWACMPSVKEISLKAFCRLVDLLEYIFVVYWALSMQTQSSVFTSADLYRKNHLDVKDIKHCWEIKWDEDTVNGAVNPEDKKHGVMHIDWVFVSPLGWFVIVLILIRRIWCHLDDKTEKVENATPDQAATVYVAVQSA